jgi:hypothetical protein
MAVMLKVCLFMHGNVTKRNFEGWLRIKMGDLGRSVECSKCKP